MPQRSSSPPAVPLVIIVANSMSERTPLLILGLGNVLLEDDGVGSAAVRALLDRYVAPADVRVLDGGTLGLSLLPYVDAADAVILVDAVKAEAAPGTSCVLTATTWRLRSPRVCRRIRLASLTCWTAHGGSIVYRPA